MLPNSPSVGSSPGTVVRRTHVMMNDVSQKVDKAVDLIRQCETATAVDKTLSASLTPFFGRFHQLADEMKACLLQTASFQSFLVCARLLLSPLSSLLPSSRHVTTFVSLLPRMVSSACSRTKFSSTSSLGFTREKYGMRSMPLSLCAC